MTPGLRFFEACYRRLLWLYTADFRHAHSTEAVEFFRDLYRDGYRRRGLAGAVTKAGRAFCDLILSAFLSRLDNARGSGSSPQPRHKQEREPVMTTVRDLVYAVRTLARAPGFALIAIITLALGIGANAAIFSLVNGVLLRPLPYPDPDRLVNVWQVNEEWLDSPDPLFRNIGELFPVSMAVANDWVERATAFESVGAYGTQRPTLDFGDRVEQVWVSTVTSGVLRALGVAPLLGRTFVPDDDEVGADAVVVLGYPFWQSQFGGDSAVIGQTITLSSRTGTIVGVMPTGFRFPNTRIQLWTTLPDDRKQGGRDWQFLEAVARLRPGLSLEGASRQMEAMNAQLIEDTNGEHEYGVRIVSRTTQVVGDARLILLVLLGTVAAVLLIACANIANLLLVRATARRREMAMRSALGASRGRLIRQLLTESFVIGGVGGIAGLALAVAMFQPLLSFLPSGLPRTDEVALDHWVLLFSFGLSLVTGLIVGVLPALSASRTGITEVLQEGGRGFMGGRRRRRAHGALVASEISLAFVLLVASGLLVKSFVRLTTVDLGFDAGNLTQVYVTLPRDRYEEVERQTGFLRAFEDRLEAIPGVQSVAFADNMPFAGGTSSTTMTAETASGRQETSLQFSAVSPDYFEALGIPILAGRAFSDADRAGSAPVVIVSEGAARELWPNENPVGKRLARGDLERAEYEWRTVVGVVGDVIHQRLDREPRPKFYEPALQGWRIGYIAMIKTSGEAAPLRGAVTNALRDIDPAIPVPTVVTLASQIASSVAIPRFRTWLVTMLAGLAGLLAVVGIYGVMAYATAQRTAEIGVRIALGARSGDVVGDVLKRAAGLAAVGLVIGVGIALAAVRVLGSMLFETTVYDPMTFVGAGVLLGLAALTASYVPARRATRVDPVEALRAE